MTLDASTAKKLLPFKNTSQDEDDFPERGSNCSLEAGQQRRDGGLRISPLEKHVVPAATFQGGRYEE
jgi:hypothetical protein